MGAKKSSKKISGRPSFWTKRFLALIGPWRHPEWPKSKFFCTKQKNMKFFAKKHLLITKIIFDNWFSKYDIWLMTYFRVMLSGTKIFLLQPRNQILNGISQIHSKHWIITQVLRWDFFFIQVVRNHLMSCVFVQALYLHWT